MEAQKPLLKVYVDLPEFIGPGVKPSQAMFRVVKALKKHVIPGVTIVTDANVADVIVLHVIGYPETVARAEAIKAAGKQYALMQYCLRTTQEPRTQAWWKLWREAACVWSYYDLEQAIADDGGFKETKETRGQALPAMNFYHAPLGVDIDVFKQTKSIPRKRENTIITSGYVAEVEGVRECEEATRLTNQKMFHLGPDLGFRPHVRWRNGINDQILAQIYSQYWFVAGLRREEGFEMCAAEGACCGAVPVVFDTPTYRKWYEGLAYFVPEGDFNVLTGALVQLFSSGSSPLYDNQIELARQRFDWGNLVPGFYQKVLSGVEWGPLGQRTPPWVPPQVQVISKPVLLFCGDAVISSGFAKGTHNTCAVLNKYFDVHVLGINYFGDPHPYQEKIWSCRSLSSPATDLFGIKRLPELVTKLRPSVTIVQNDWWNFKPYLQAIGNSPVVGIVAVDGKNCSRARELNGLRHAIFWTEFGRQEAHKGGYEGLSSVIPLGVNLEIYKPADVSKAELRQRSGWPEETYDAFVVCSVNRNQLRKRLDLVVTRFCEWVKDFKINDAYLFVHTSPTGDVGFDVQQGMEYYGLGNRLILSIPEPGFGAPERAMRHLYCSVDLMFSQTQGEGFGLPHIEAAACGVTSVVPNWAALAEWPGNAFWQIPCTDTAWTIGGPNTIGGIADPMMSVAALQHLYSNRDVLANFNRNCLELVQDPRYRWENIGEQVANVVKNVLNDRPLNIDIQSRVSIANPELEVMVK